MDRKKLIYIGSILIITVIISVTYFSYAFFTNKQEFHGKLNIVAGTLDYRISSNDLTNNSITLAAGEVKELEISIKSLNDIESKYELYYTTTNNDIAIGYSSNTVDQPTGTINSKGTKKITVAIKNKTESAATLTFGVQGGFKEKVITLSQGSSISEQLDLCGHIMCEWFAYNNYQNYEQSEVLTDSEKLNSLMNNSEAVDYLTSNAELISSIKANENYEQYIVPAILNYAKTSTTNNSKMYAAKLPAYIYNYGTYYLISSFTYVAPSNSCQSRSFNNTAANGLYFYLAGTTSASESHGINYSDQSVNPYGYTKLNVDYTFSRNLDYEVSYLYICNGSASRANWVASFSGCIATMGMPIGNNLSYMNLSALSVNSNYRIVLEQRVNKYQTSGNYYNTVYIRSMYLS